ncbi:MAG: hypothetical protein RM368_16500 [Nostoc sp. DedSLP03]|uniref:hypothetical protein n=1 Tax=Nostoc sp. DedSLP03 TaxID=3075400 RepID=UPI002AD4F756|nr:hypothetical protein [Nostoc sp. DedSLP03]MDZ7966552.1 hypothetical protein [Nostoc sp. DedSLP03]
MILNLFFTDLLSYSIEKGSSRKQSDVYDELGVGVARRRHRISCLTLFNYYPFIISSGTNSSDRPVFQGLINNFYQSNLR